MLSRGIAKGLAAFLAVGSRSVGSVRTKAQGTGMLGGMQAAGMGAAPDDTDSS